MYLPLNLPPGIVRLGTEYGSKGHWYDANLVRFHSGTIQPWGGWRAKSETAIVGKGRSALTWTDNSGLTWTAIGTHSHVYIMDRAGTLADITPLRDTGTLGSDPFAVVNGDATVTVTDTAHGLAVGDYVVFSGASSVGGLAMNAEWVVATVPNANSYTFEHISNANATVSGGGAAVTYSYLITTGRADAVAQGGYGSGSYGGGTYGTPREDTSTIQDASRWSFDTFGENLQLVRDDHGTVYQWVPPTTSTRAASVTNAPQADALVTTGEGILFLLGADANQRNLSWCDQRDNTDWTPTATNQAGDFDIETYGKLLCGRRVTGGTLLLTATDAHLATYTADILVYSFQRAAENCGAVGRGALAGVDGGAVWMGRGTFWLYNGYVQPLPCPVLDYVFSDFNTLQASKVSVTSNPRFGEITWWYCSGAATEIDRYVTWNYRENHWNIGTLTRLCGVFNDVYSYPLLIGDNGTVYEHEVGFDYDDEVPFLESGPMELGNGDVVMHARQLVPDEKTLGDVTATFKVRFYPKGDETSFGPYTLTAKTDVRFTGRQAKVRYAGAQMADWRIGSPRLELIAGGRR